MSTDNDIVHALDVNAKEYMQKMCEDYPCNPDGDCVTCSATWTGFPKDPRGV